MKSFWKEWGIAKEELQMLISGASLFCSLILYQILFSIFF